MLMRFFIFKIYENSLAGRHNNSSLFVMARSRKWLNSQRHKNEKSFCEFARSCRVEKRDFCESFQSVHLTKTLLDTFRRKEERGKKGQIVIADSFAFDGEREWERDGKTFISAVTMKNFSNGKWSCWWQSLGWVECENWEIFFLFNSWNDAKLKFLWWFLPSRKLIIFILLNDDL